MLQVQTSAYPVFSYKFHRLDRIVDIFHTYLSRGLFKLLYNAGPLIIPIDIMKNHSLGIDSNNQFLKLIQRRPIYWGMNGIAQRKTTAPPYQAGRIGQDLFGKI